MNSYFLRLGFPISKIIFFNPNTTNSGPLMWHARCRVCILLVGNLGVQILLYIPIKKYFIIYIFYFRKYLFGIG